MKVEEVEEVEKVIEEELPYFDFLDSLYEKKKKDDLKEHKVEEIPFLKALPFSFAG